MGKEVMKMSDVITILSELSMMSEILSKEAYTRYIQHRLNKLLSQRASEKLRSKPL